MEAKDKAGRIKRAKTDNHLRDFVDRFPPDLALVPKEQDKEPIRVNSLLLCWKSQPFCSGLSKDQPDRLDMKDWSAASLQIMADFLLTNKCPEIESCTLTLEVMALAHRYDMSDLEEKASSDFDISTQDDFNQVIKHLETYKNEALAAQAFGHLKHQSIQDINDMALRHGENKAFHKIHDWLLDLVEKRIEQMYASCHSTFKDFLQNHQNWLLLPNVSLLEATRHLPYEKHDGERLIILSILKKQLISAEVTVEVENFYCEYCNSICKDYDSGKDEK